MTGDGALLWEANAVTAHFRDDVLPEDDDVLRTVLDTAGITGEHGAGYTTLELRYDTRRQSRSAGKNYGVVYGIIKIRFDL